MSDIDQVPVPEVEQEKQVEQQEEKHEEEVVESKKRKFEEEDEKQQQQEEEDVDPPHFIHPKLLTKEMLKAVATWSDVYPIEGKCDVVYMGIDMDKVIDIVFLVLEKNSLEKFSELIVQMSDHIRTVCVLLLLGSRLHLDILPISLIMDKFRTISE
jgi:hypothetical protein